MTGLCVSSRLGREDSDPGAAAAHCRPIRGSHLGGCDDEKCRGCLPQLAADPLKCCAACNLRVSDRLKELAQLWVDLLTPTRSAGGGKRAPGSERPQALGSEAREARTAIRRLLTTWCGVLVDDFGVAVPGPAVEVRVARLLAHLPRLLADPRHAEQLIHDVDMAWAEGRRRAYPAAPQGHHIGDCPVGTPAGPCGGPVRAVVGEFDEAGWAECRTCKTKAVIEWWLALMPPEQHEWLPMKALRWHLTLHSGRQIAEQTIRNWASPTARNPDPALPSMTDTETQRIVYRVEEARALCELTRRRGRPALDRSA